MSWTGSETQRRPQGICRPPAVESDQRPRFFIKKGTYVCIRPVGKTGWTGFKTRRDLEFNRYEHRSPDSWLIFRDAGYQIRIPKRKVVDRTKA